MIMLIFFIIGVHYLQSWNIDRETRSQLYSIQQIFKEKLKDDTLLMGELVGSLKEDKNLQKAWLLKDRKMLLNYAGPLFKKISSQYRITHFNFIDPERTSFLRVHSPEFYGDYIMRSTMDRAVGRGIIASGIELGTLGNFVLRVVHPWRINGKLVGYIELGKGIEHITSHIKEATDTELFFVIKKSFLSREYWKRGLKIMGKKGDWDQFKDFVVIDQTMSKTPLQLKKYLDADHAEYEELEHQFKISENDQKYRGGFIHLFDAGGYEVGDIVALKDVTNRTTVFNILLAFAILISFVISGLLYYFFFFFVGRLEQKLVNTHDNLKTEIEQRTGAEEKVKVVNQELEQIFNTSADGICLIDKDLNIQKVNKTFLKLFGISNEECIGKKCYEVSPSSACHTPNCPMSLILNGSSVIQEEMEFKKEDDKKLTCIMAATPFYGSDGEILGILKDFKDITERKSFEETVKKEKNKLQKYLDIAATVFLVINKDQKVSLINRRGCDILGYSSEEVIGKNWFDNFLPQRVKAGIKDLFQQILAGETFLTDRYENPVLTKDGRERIILWHNTVIRDDEGNIIGILSSGEDITERKQAEQKFKTLTHLSKKMNSMVLNDEFFLWMATKAAEILEADGCLFRLREGDELVLKGGTKEAVKIMKKKRIKLGESLGGLVAKDKKPVTSEDLHNDERFLKKHRELAKKFGFCSFLCVPIMSSGEVIGIVNVISKKKRKFNQNDIDVLSSFTDMAAVALDNQRLFGELGKEIGERRQAEKNLQDKAEQLKMLNELGRQFNFIIDITELLPWIAEQAAMLLNTDTCFYRLREGNYLVRGGGTEEGTKMMQKEKLNIGESLSGLIAKEGKPVISDDYPNDPRHIPEHREIAEKYGFQSFLGVPMMRGHDVVGVINVCSKEAKRFTQKDAELLSSFADMAAIAIQNARLFKKLEKEIGERKQAEKNLKLAHSEIEQLFTSITSILIGVSSEDRITKWNKRAEEVFSVAEPDVIGKQLSESGIEWEWDRIRGAISMCREKSCKVNVDDLTYKHPDGKEKLLGLTINPIKNESDQAPGLLIMGADITDRKILENQLAQSQKLESIGQLAAGIAHEINSPMQYINDNTHFIKKKMSRLFDVVEKSREVLEASKSKSLTEELVKEVESFIEEARIDYLKEEFPEAISQSLEGIDRVIKIVQAMKEFSHPGVEEKISTDLNKAIESTITVARNEWKYVAEMLTDFDSDLPLVPCLPGEFNQAILNIITNAAHAISNVIEEGSDEKGVIRVSTERENGWVKIKISDTGSGIPEEVRKRIFDPFFTTKDVGKGTGQGLSIAHSVIVGKHGGEISVDTEEGKGTTFTICLPLNQEEKQREEA